MSRQDQIADIGVDLLHHTSLILKGIMSVGAYALYKRYFGTDLNSEAAQNVRQQLPALANESEDGQVHSSELEVVIEEQS